MGEASIANEVERTRARSDVATTVRDYLRHFEGDAAVETRRERYAAMVNQYYDLVTDFYERGWGRSFHFAPRYRGEAFAASLARHEHYLALRLGLGPGTKVLDLGCGVGGPMREIARFSGATVVGINNNAHQVEKLRQYNREAGLDGLCSAIEADFMALPLEDASFGAAYAIEATCHAPDKARLFAEVRRVLEPGGLFASYEWCLTDAYDPTDATHRDLKRRIEVGDGLPDLATIRDVPRALEEAGFEVLDAFDAATTGDPETPWYLPLEGEPGLAGLPRSTLGRFLTRGLVAGLERLGVAPEGSSRVSAMLNDAADALVEAGRRGIFTPAYFFLARRPS